jgi:poly-beta-1,6-N-acetyl-D-glucosamine biosynthesis protein PgaD
MQSGEALIGKPSTGKALLSRKWSKRSPLPAGILSLLTVGFWALWIYLVMPLVSLLLWAFGVRLFLEKHSSGEGLGTSLVAYSSILLVLIVLLGLWIAWNVMRYGGSNDRRTVKRAEASDERVQEAFRLDDSLLEVMRAERSVRIDLDQDGCVMVIPATISPGRGPDDRDPDRPDVPRERARA